MSIIRLGRPQRPRPIHDGLNRISDEIVFVLLNLAVGCLPIETKLDKIGGGRKRRPLACPEAEAAAVIGGHGPCLPTDPAMGQRAVFVLGFATILRG